MSSAPHAVKWAFVLLVLLELAILAFVDVVIGLILLIVTGIAWRIVESRGLGASRYPCPACREPIIEGATVCPHCRTELRWSGKRVERADAAASDS